MVPRTAPSTWKAKPPSVSASKETLRTLAEGHTGKAAGGNQLSEVYANIGSSLGWKTEHRDISAR
ncbi:hypothetical protein [Actinomadura sp. 6N118]|uniref:hypothetical protein n=1 Tax=Actinomadura sp. 6N118 TaxID=3375151 RepID=UPI0037B2D658